MEENLPAFVAKVNNFTVFQSPSLLPFKRHCRGTTFVLANPRTHSEKSISQAYQHQNPKTPFWQLSLPPNLTHRSPRWKNYKQNQITREKKKERNIEQNTPTLIQSNIHPLINLSKTNRCQIPWFSPLIPRNFNPEPEPNSRKPSSKAKWGWGRRRRTRRLRKAAAV